MILKGTAVSPGISAGKVYLYEPFTPELREKNISGDEVASSLERYEEVRKTAQGELDEIQKILIDHGKMDKAKILSAHIELLFDPAIEEDIRSAVEDDQYDLVWAIHTVLERYIKILSKKDNELIRERTADLRDVKNRLIRCAMGIREKGLSQLSQPVVLVCRDLLPSDTASLDPAMVRAIVTEEGGYTSHSAIIARGYEIPAVLGVPQAASLLQEGETVIVDAFDGTVVTEPTEKELESCSARQKEYLLCREQVKTYQGREPVTTDGKRIQVELNIGAGSEEELESMDFADGVGLFRTEFLYLHQSSLPTEEEQFSVYKKVLTRCQGKPVVLRTLDIGGDKKMPALQMPAEENPFLGMRAVRLCFEHPEMFKTQLRAALRAGIYGELWLMFPMVGNLEDIERIKVLLEEARQELEKQGKPYSSSVKTGVMIEIPTMAVMADQVAEMVDFASIGTNDLIQYTLAVDRMNPKLSGYYQKYHPAVLRLIRHTIDAFRRVGKPVGVCGEMAGDEKSASLLLGLGAQYLSMSPASVAKIKKMICTHSMEEFEKAANHSLSLNSAAEVEKYLDAQL